MFPAWPMARAPFYLLLLLQEKFGKILLFENMSIIICPLNFFDLFGLSFFKEALYFHLEALLNMPVLLFFIVFFGLTGVAYAYVDPGSISIMLQVLAAFFLGAMITMRQRLKAIFQYLARLVGLGKKEDEPEDDDGPSD